MLLNEKETMLLQDLKEDEKLCIEKYGKYASEACDGKLKNIFSEIGQAEQQHYNTISQILGGSVPNMNTGYSQQAKPQQQSSNQSLSYGQQEKTNDKYLCSDVLGTEKHVSSTYDTSIFEFKDENVRNTLNHIQKEEQEHGKKIYDYMEQNGMYN